MSNTFAATYGQLAILKELYQDNHVANTMPYGPREQFEDATLAPWHTLCLNSSDSIYEIIYNANPWITLINKGEESNV